MANPFEYRESMRALIYEGKQPQAKPSRRKGGKGKVSAPQMSGPIPKHALDELRRMHEMIKAGPSEE